MADLVLHVGWVQRVVGYRIRNRVREFGSLQESDLTRIGDLDPREWGDTSPVLAVASRPVKYRGVGRYFTRPWPCTGNV